MLRNVLLHPGRKLLKLRSPTFGSPGSWLPREAHSNNSALPAAPQLAFLTSPEETNEARAWISRFKSQPITRGSVELSFSRSSGPGGQVCATVRSRIQRQFLISKQNVNKVNTKATLRCPVDSPWIPLWARNELKKSVGSTRYVHKVCTQETQYPSGSHTTRLHHRCC